MLNRIFIGMFLFWAHQSSMALASEIEGYWVNGGGDAVIEIRIQDDKLILHLVSTFDPVLLDSNNPDSSLRQRNVAGIELGSGFRYENEQWRNGKIYDPGSGKTYKGRITVVDSNQLSLRGYVGIAALGRSETWLRLEEFEKRMISMLKAGETRND